MSQRGDLIGDGKICIQIPQEWNCVPDGMTIDSKGMLWIALWGGSAVACWDPNTGRHLLNVELPCSLVTSCCFGGSYFNKLYITTARTGLDKHDLARMPLSGAIFEATVDATGTPPSVFLETASMNI